MFKKDSVVSLAALGLSIAPPSGATLLVVDDQPANLRLMAALLAGEGYRIMTANCGAEALAMLTESAPHLILVDVMMPGMSGIDLVGKLKSDPRFSPIPVMMVTSLDARETRLAALSKGAEDFIQKPIDRTELKIRVRNLVNLKLCYDALQDQARLLEAQVAARTEQVVHAYREAIFTLTCAAEYKDEETGAHVQRISHYAAQLADRLGMGTSFRDEIFHASPMHDIGKIGIPDAILLKPGKLDAAEWESMKTHAALGAGILARATSPYLCMGRDIAQGHHERWDGTGYPGGLTGEATPLAARIVMICDIYDALRSKRPYKPPFSHERALEIILQGDGRTLPCHFDPAVFEAFGGCAADFAAIFEKLAD